MAGAMLAICSVASGQAAVTTAADQSAHDGVYRLAAGDKLRITVFNEPRLTGEYNISAAGNVSFPMLGPVDARGQSTEALQGMIHDQLAQRGYIKNAMVNVEVVSYRPYYILGEVSKPDKYEYAVGLRLEQAVAAAGGYTYRANRRDIFVTHFGQDREQRVKLKEGSQYVMPGDTIRVGERYF